MMNQGRFCATVMLLGAGITLTLAACSDDGFLGPNEGRVRFVLSSDGAGAVISGDESVSGLLEAQPGSVDSVVLPSLHGEASDGDHAGWFQSANVTFSSVLARNQDGVLENVAMELPVVVDVLKMEDGKEIVLPDGALPAATYDQIIVVMTKVEGVDPEGAIIAITPPGGGWTAIVPVCPFTVDEGSTTVVGLTLKLRNAFLWRDRRYHFQPRFTCGAEDSGESS